MPAGASDQPPPLDDDPVDAPMLLTNAPSISPEALERGFGGDADRLRRFVATLQAALPAGTIIVLRGSTVAGTSYETGDAFDAAGPGTSDLDIVVIGDATMELFDNDARLMGGINTLPLSDKEPGIAPALDTARRAAQAIVGRPVSIQAMTTWFLFMRSIVQDQPFAVLSPEA
ncbi:MAG: hypothetical protein ACHQ02_00830 [Candidatus Limnocylindrales bacterium]